MKPVSGEIRSTALPLCCLVPDTLIHMQNSVDNIGTDCFVEKLAKFKKILILTFRILILKDLVHVIFMLSCRCRLWLPVWTGPEASCGWLEHKSKSVCGAAAWLGLSSHNSLSFHSKPCLRQVVFSSD